MQEFIQQLLDKISELTDVVTKQTAELSNFSTVIARLEKTVSAQAEIIKELEEENARLKELNGMNSSNSSCPPSSDGYNKPKPKSLRKPSGKSQGGQLGHKGSNNTLKLENPDKIEKHFPSKCADCPLRDTCLQHAKVTKRYVADVEVKPLITEHDLIEMPVCPMHEKVVNDATFPSNVKSYIQYGSSLRALVVSLSTAGAVSVDRIHKILSSVFEIQISTGTIANMVSECAKILSNPLRLVKNAVTWSPVANFDETGFRAEGTLYWVHSASDLQNTYLTLNKKRGKLGMDAADVLPNFKGIAVHDCWGAYFKYREQQHALCNGHFLRELQAVIDNHPEQTWASDFQKLLLEMKKARDEAIASGRDAIEPEVLHRFESEYDRLTAIGLRENPEPAKSGKRGKKKRSKTLNLLLRLVEYKEAITLFAHNFAVPFTNNGAEQSVRNCKTKIKVAGCFRNVSGAEDYLTITSYTATAIKRGKNPYLMLKEAISGNPYLIFA